MRSRPHMGAAEEQNHPRLRKVYDPSGSIQPPERPPAAAASFDKRYRITEHDQEDWSQARWDCSVVVLQ